ncbi:MAG TPA: hypothetical protein DD811_11545 [Syntrophomonas sp.]|jgi:hypothetical protein|nr:hypothetical protein [Syntrophomonas sp.]
MMFFVYVIAAFLAAGIISTVLIITFYEKKPINPYLPALVVWLLGFLIHANGMVRSMMFNIDPFGQILALSVMAITVISSVIFLGDCRDMDQKTEYGQNEIEEIGNNIEYFGHNCSAAFHVHYKDHFLRI